MTADFKHRHASRLLLNEITNCEKEEWQNERKKKRMKRFRQNARQLTETFCLTIDIQSGSQATIKTTTIQKIITTTNNNNKTFGKCWHSRWFGWVCVCVCVCMCVDMWLAKWCSVFRFLYDNCHKCTIISSKNSHPSDWFSFFWSFSFFRAENYAK